VLIDLPVFIFIITTLAGLLLPATFRQKQCENLPCISIPTGFQGLRALLETSMVLENY